MGTRGAGAALAAVLVVLAASGPAHAQSARTHRVTLVTGDRAVLTVQADGTQSVTVGRSSKSFHTIKADGDVYAYPVDLVPYLGKLLDRELFNVSKLVEQGYADRASGSIPLIVTHKRADDR